MTRDEIIEYHKRLLKKRVAELQGVRDTRPDIMVDLFESIIRELKQSQPDTETGLVPCGCGGEVGIDHWREDSGKTEGEWNVICERCRLMFVDNFETEQDTRDAWNRAMGYREADE